MNDHRKEETVSLYFRVLHPDNVAIRQKEAKRKNLSGICITDHLD